MIYKNFSQKDFDEAEQAYNNCTRKTRVKPTPIPKRQKFSKGQSTALLIAFLITIYSIFSQDIPGFFLGISFCVWMLQYFTYKLTPAHQKAAVSLLKALSLTLFFGSIVLLFL